MNLLDLFSGIGGFHLGLERAGFKINSFNSEINKYANQVYKNNFKNSTYVGSVADVRGSDLPRINAITFGSPCQDFSLAGKQKGMGGERSSLILEAIRLVKECRPDFFIWENVKGTFSSNSGEDFAAILQAFTNIGGYRLEWQLLNTKWFLPQNRERVYLVGYTSNKSGGQIFPITRESNGVIKNNKINIGSARTRKYMNQAQKLEIRNDNSTNTLTSVQKDNYVLGYSRDRKGKVMSRHKKKLANTLHASSGSGNNTDQFINSIRKLTPLECERLQGFPDDWTKFGTEGLISNTQRYKMCGNAVTVDVVEAVGKQILKL
jgi:DNA (cytosine-5)-methyltransferase 1|tara:strand:+ start:41 stop:1000 length:960 start_codon:yes stop_codon:yes gene_type:complete